MRWCTAHIRYELTAVRVLGNTRRCGGGNRGPVICTTATGVPRHTCPPQRTRWQLKRELLQREFAQSAICLLRGLPSAFLTPCSMVQNQRNNCATAATETFCCPPAHDGGKADIDCNLYAQWRTVANPLRIAFESKNLSGGMTSHAGRIPGLRS